MAEAPDWSVVAIAREEPEVIRRFVAWHLAAGASQITLFFDDPYDPCISMVGHLPQVKPVGCAPEFWQSIGLTQDTRFTLRQNRACRLGYDAAPRGWVLVIDADELIHVEGRSVAGFLSEQPDDLPSVLVEPAEHVLTGDGSGGGGGQVFRQKTPRPLVREVYGDVGPLIVRNDGMVGHNVGKSFYRTGIEKMWLRQHYAQLPGGERLVSNVANAGQGAYLLHFFSRGYDDWRRKLDYRLTNQGFRPRMRSALQDLRDSGDEAALRAMYERLHSLSDDQLMALDEVGAILRTDFDFDEIVSRYFD